MILLLILFGFLVFCSFRYSNSHKLFLIFFAIGVVSYGLNYSNGDYAAYHAFYYERSYLDWGVELIYGGLSDLFKYFNLDFFEFKLFIAFITLALHFRFFSYFTNVKALLAALYLLFFFSLDYVLMRNFLAVGVVLQGVLALLKNDKSSVLFFVLCVFVATLIHQSSVLYMFLAICFYRFKEPVLLYAFCFALFAVLYYFLRLAVFNSTLFAERALLYDGNLNMFFVNVLIYIVNLIFAGLFYFSNRVWFWCNPIFIRYFWGSNFGLFFVLIVMLDVPIFLRIFKTIFLLNACLITNACYSFNFKKRIRVMPIVVLYLFFCFALFVFPVYELTLDPLFSYNCLFEVSLCRQ